MREGQPLYLVRHAKYVKGNKSSDPPLDSIGLSQTAYTADLLSSQFEGTYPLIVVSPLKRARQTGFGIQRSLDHASLRVDPALREIFPQGDIPRGEYIGGWATSRQDRDSIPFGDESINDVGTRVHKAVMRYGRNPQRPLIMVAHLGPILGLIEDPWFVDKLPDQLKGTDLAEANELIPNASVTKVVMNESGRLAVVSLGSTEHLPKNLITA